MTDPTDGTSSLAPTYAYLTREKGVRGGNAIIAHTRVGVHDVIGLLQNLETVDTIVSRCFPNLTRVPNKVLSNTPESAKALTR